MDLKKCLMTAVLLIGCGAAQASYDYTGTIKMVYTGPGYSGKVFIQVESAPGGTVSCDTNTTFDFGFDGTTAIGKVMLSAVLTAYSLGSTIRLTSYDTCTVYSGIPDLYTISLK